jgi:L-ascorbate metabolism protein UlaG (beta-lactamase superfamily)
MDTLTYIGHSTTLLRQGGAAIITDPMLRDWLGPLRRQGPSPAPDLLAQPDVILISHLHRDHLDLPSLRRLPEEAVLVVPRGASRWVARSGREIRELGRGETMNVGGIEVTGVRADHGGHRHRRGEEIEPLGYVIDAGDRRTYFAGDTDLFDEMSEIGPVDVALLPVWGWGPKVGAGHLDPQRAADALTLLGPRTAVPIHWGTFYPAGLRRLSPGPLVEPPREFARLAAETAPEVEIRILEPGEETAL